MTVPNNLENPYQAPQAQVSQVREFGSPRRRFWLSCLAWFLPIPSVATLFIYLLPNWFFAVLAGLIVLWILTVIWVIQAHRSTALIHRTIVAIGLTISLAVCYFLGLALLLAPVFNKPIDVRLPQRGT